MIAFRYERVFFILCLAVFLIHQYVQRIAAVPISFADHYLDPLLCLPVLLPILRTERSFLLREPQYRFDLTHILVYFLLISLIGEFLFPALSDSFFYDPSDIPAYALGGTFYYLLFGKRLR